MAAETPLQLSSALKCRVFARQMARFLVTWQPPCFLLFRRTAGDQVSGFQCGRNKITRARDFHRVIVPRELIASIRRSRVVTRYFSSQKAKRSFFYLLIQHVRYVYKVGSILPRFLNVPKSYKTKLIARLVLRQKGKIYWPTKEYKPKRIQARKLFFPRVVYVVTSKKSVPWEQRNPNKHVCQLRPLERNKLCASAAPFRSCC